MPYEFPEDYKQLQDDFLADKHLINAGAGSEQVSATVSNQLAVRVKMIARLEETNVSKAVGFLLMIGVSAYEENLKKAAKNAELQELADELFDNS